MTTQKSAIAYLRATAQRRANESKVQLDSEEQVLAFLDTVRGFNEDKKCGSSYIPDDHTCHADKPANAMQKAFKQRTKAAKLKQGSGSFNGIDKDSLLKVATGAAGIAAVAGAAGLARGYYSNGDSPSKQIGQQNQISEINLTGQLANAEFEKEENQIGSSENLTPALPKVTNNTEAPKTFVEVANPAYKELAEEINSEIDKVSTRIQKSISEGKTFGNPRDAYGARFELLQEEIEDIEDPEEREKLREGLRQKKETIDSLILSANRFTPERLSRYDLNLEPHTGNTSNLQNGLKDWSQFSKANFTQADGADALLNDQQYIQNKIEENQASYSPKNVLSVSKEGKVQAIALIKDEADGVAIDWLTSAPWNVVQGHPESVKGAGTAIMEQAFRLSQERGFGGKVYISGFSGTSGGFYRSFGAVIGTKGTEIPPEKAQQFLNSIDEARRIQRNRSDADEFERSVNFVLCVLASEELYSEAVLPAKIKHVKKIDAAEKMPDFAAQLKNNTRYDKKCGASYIPNHYTCHVSETATSAMQKTFKQRTGRPKLKQGIKSFKEMDKDALMKIAAGAVGVAAVAGVAGFAAGAASGYYSTEEGARERINQYKQKADQASAKARKEIEAEYQRQLKETEARLTKEADDRVSEAVSELESQYQSSTASVTDQLNSQISELEANRQVELANLEAEKEEAVKKVAEEVAGQEQAKAEKAIQAERDRFAAEQAKVQKQYAEQVAKLEAEKNSAIAKAEAESSTRSTLQAERDAMQREFTKQVVELEKAKNEAIEQATKEAHESAQKRILEERQRYSDERTQLVDEYESKLEKATTPKPRNNKPGGMVSESGKGINLSASIIQGKVIATEDNPKVGTSKSALEKQVLDNVRNLKNEEYQRIQRDLAEEFREQTKKITAKNHGSMEARWREIEAAIIIQGRREARLNELLGNGGSEWEKARTDHARFVQDLDISSPEALKDAARRFDRKAQQSFRDMIKAVERELSESKQKEMKFDSVAIPLGASSAFKAGLERAFKRDAGSCPPTKHWVKDPRVKKGGGYCRTSQSGGKLNNLTQKVAAGVNSPAAKKMAKGLVVAGVGTVAATAIAGAVATGGAAAVRERYRANVAKSAQVATQLSMQMEERMRSDAARRLGKSPEEVTSYEASVKTWGGTELYGQTPDSEGAIFVIGAKEVNGQGGRDLAKGIINAQMSHWDVIPLENKITQPGKKPIDEQDDFLQQQEARNQPDQSQRRKLPGPLEKVRSAAGFAKGFDYLSENMAKRGFNPDAVNAAAEIAAQRRLTGKPATIISYSAGGGTASETLAILKEMGIRDVKVANIAGPTFGTFDHSKDDLRTFVSEDDELMQGKVPFQNVEKVSSGLSHFMDRRKSYSTDSATWDQINSFISNSDQKNQWKWQEVAWKVGSGEKVDNATDKAIVAEVKALREQGASATELKKRGLELIKSAYSSDVARPDRKTRKQLTRDRQSYLEKIWFQGESPADIDKRRVQQGFASRLPRAELPDPWTTDSARTDLSYWFQQRALRQDKGQGGCPKGEHWVAQKKVKGGGFCRKNPPRSAASNNPVSPNDVRLESPALLFAFAPPGGQVLGLAAVGALAALDVKRNMSNEKTMYWTEDGQPDAKVMERYDSFEPGDMIRREFESPFGIKQHYAVYVGKDPKTGEHMSVDVGGTYGTNSPSYAIRYTGLTWNSSPKISHYERVPPEEMNGGQGSPFSKKEIVDRAIRAAGQPVDYRFISGNCEVFARGIVEGQARSTQGEQFTKLSDITEGITSNAFLGLKLRASGLKTERAHVNQILDTIAKNRSIEVDDTALAILSAGFKNLPKEEQERRKEILRDRLNNKQDLILALQKQVRSDSKDNASLISGYLSAAGLKSPAEYEKLVNATAKAFPGSMNQQIKQQMYKNYLLVMFGILNPDAIAKT